MISGIVSPVSKPAGRRTARAYASASLLAAIALSAGFALLHAQAQVPAAAAGTAPQAGVPGRGGPPIGVPTVGMPGVHDPSTVVRFHGLYYVYTTGRGAPFLSSPDLVTWTRQGSVFPQIPEAVHAAVPKNNGTDVWAPDIVRVGNLFYLYYAVSSWGSFQSAVALATNPVLDPKDPAYHWTDRGPVVTSDGQEDLNAIDPGVILAPDGTLWICYGSYHGSIRITQLDPKTGLAFAPKKLGEAIATARESEASDIIFHDGFFYLFVNHGSCCKGKDSQYNIRVGRARTITGPYLDKHDVPLTKGGGSLFLGAQEGRIGPGHFGRLLDYDSSPTGAEKDGNERFSIHYEAEMSHNGRPTLDVRPLLWSTDGWPIAGDNLAEGTYQLLSRESENTLVEHIAAAPKPAAPGGPPPPAAEPAGPPTLRLGRYLSLPSEKWVISPVDGGFYKIVNVATSDAIQSTEGTLSLAPYAGSDTQMWRMTEFPNGGYEIVNKASGQTLTAPTPGTVATGPFVHDDTHLWTLTSP